MRVLWFAGPCLYKSVHETSGGFNSGGWSSSLLTELQKHSNIEIAVAFCQDGEPYKVTQNGIIYYPVPNHHKRIRDKIIDIIKYRDETRDEILWEHYTNRFNQIINDFNPDIIEIFGSELYHGLSALCSGYPIILHVQGILNVYREVLLIPGFSKKKFVLKDGWRGIYNNWQYLIYWNRSCHRERVILNNIKNFIGRTEWDENMTKVFSPRSTYYYGGEMLRESFYDCSERKLPAKCIITTTISAPLYKGTDLLLKIAKVLKHDMNIDFQWNVYGNINFNYAEKLLGYSHKEVNINCAGVVTEQELSEKLQGTTVYCHTSYIENSPNSVCEAQIIGVPVVATNVGGTNSLVDHNKTGFLFSPMEPYYAAYYIRKLILDESLNKEMGKKSKEIAQKRHNRVNIAKELINTYTEVIQRFNEQ